MGFTGLGTVVNVGAVLLGATIGLLIKKGLSERFQHTIMCSIGLATIFIGISGAMTGLMGLEDGGLTTQNTMLMVLSLVMGALVGELIDIERRLDRLGQWCRKKLRFSKSEGEEGGSSFVEGFVSSSLLFCVGAMAIVGAFDDGINHDYSTLFAKSLIDGVSAIIFAASLGVGVYFSCVPLLIYQGGLTLLAGVIRPYLSDLLVGQMSFVGSILIFGIGVNLIFGKKLKVGNLLPAMFMPILFQLVQSIFQ